MLSVATQTPGVCQPRSPGRPPEAPGNPAHPFRRAGEGIGRGGWAYLPSAGEGVPCPALIRPAGIAGHGARSLAPCDETHNPIDRQTMAERKDGHRTSPGGVFEVSSTPFTPLLSESKRYPPCSKHTATASH